jgi:hypothetical protein
MRILRRLESFDLEALSALAASMNELVRMVESEDSPLGKD